MQSTRQSALQYAQDHQVQFLQDLQEILRIPSISTAVENKNDMQKTASWIAAQMNALDLINVQIFQTPGHPVVFGEYRSEVAGAKTVLVYGHYDVQPPEPLELWKSEPFIPTVRGDNLYARGASDMKGQVMASLKAFESVIRQGPLPLNVKFMIEGEEEIGSPNLAAFMEQHADLLACDFALNPDAGMIAPDIPTIVTGLRGLAYFEVRFNGPERDLHSGSFGGVVHNPAQALCEFIASLHDEKGHVTLPGFYDSVDLMTEEQHQHVARLPITAEKLRSQTGVPELWGEPEYTPVERLGFRPTLEVNGFLSGFTGVGSKTVIPATAMAKISMRLVPNQDPMEIHRSLLEYLSEKVPATIRWELITLGGSPACRTDSHHPAAESLAQAMQTVWGVLPAYKNEGGSVPVVGDMQRILHADSVLTGFGLPDDAIHAPNEKLHLPTWYKGINALIHFFYNLI